MSDADALGLLERLPEVHIASTDRDGAPVFRTVNYAIADGALAFHGAPAGEKLEIAGRAAVFAASETVASIPSYFLDPERACPATTLYRSVQVHGTVEVLDDDDAKARVLAALMAKYQPEGGYRPLRADDPMYRKAIAGLLVMRVPLTRIDGKAKLGQNRTPHEVCTLMERLWERGGTHDPAAIEALREANPTAPVPRFLEAPAGARLVCACDRRDEPDTVALLSTTYWNVDIAPSVLLEAHRNTSVWVGARDERGRLVATARALADGAKFANIYDVAVDPAWRGRGLGAAVFRLLLAHPRVRGVRRAWLRTRDAMGFYERFGFSVTTRGVSSTGAATSEMERRVA